VFSIRAIVLLFFRPSRFVQMAVKHAIAQEFKSNVQLRESYPDLQLLPERQKTLTDGTWNQTRQIRRSFGRGFKWVMVALILGWVSGVIFHRTVGPALPSLIMGLQVLAAGILLGATLSLVGREIESYGGQTLPEKINDFLYRILYITGTYLLFLSLSWP